MNRVFTGLLILMIFSFGFCKEDIAIEKLNYAIYNGDVVYVKKIAFIDTLPLPSNNKNHPLLKAIKSGNREIVSILIDKYTPFDDKYFIRNLFDGAVDSGNNEILKILYNNNLATSEITNSLLSKSVRNNKESKVAFFIPLVDSLSMDSYAYYISNAIENGSKKILELLLSLNRPVHDSTSTYNVLSIALKHNRMDLFDYLLNNKNIDINAGNAESEDYEGGLTPLMVACSSGNVIATEKLIAKGADLNARSMEYENHGVTALMYAAKYGKKQCFDLLLKAGADPMLRDADGHSIVPPAVNGNNDTILQQALDLGFSLREEIKTCNWILGASVSNGNKWMFDLLIENGAATNMPKGRYPLHIAAATGQLEMLKVLIDKGFSINVLLPENFNGYGLDVLGVTAVDNQPEIFDYLLKNGANFKKRYPKRYYSSDLSKIIEPNKKSDDDSISFIDMLSVKNRINFYPIIKKHDPVYFKEHMNEWMLFKSRKKDTLDISLKTITTLYSLGANLNSIYSFTDNNGETHVHNLLQYLIRQNRYDAVEYLLKNGVDCNKIPEGCEPTIYAALCNAYYFRRFSYINMDMIKLLLNYDVDLNGKFRNALTLKEFLEKLKDILYSLKEEEMDQLIKIFKL